MSQAGKKADGLGFWGRIELDGQRQVEGSLARVNCGALGEEEGASVTWA